MELPNNWRSLTWKEIIDWGKEMECKKWELWDLPCGYFHFQIYVKVPTRYYTDTAGELITA